jgi:hypothetical protein
MPWPKVKAVVRSDLADWDSIVRAAIAFAEASAREDLGWSKHPSSVEEQTRRESSGALGSPSSWQTWNCGSASLRRR